MGDNAGMANSVWDGKSAAAANDLKPKGFRLINIAGVLGKVDFKEGCASLV